MVFTVESLPTERPARLRLASLDIEWWRIDERESSAWSWSGYPTPHNRFDVAGARVRYAARTERGAFREHFAENGRVLTARHATLQIVRLRGRIRVLDLRSERILDALGLDGEISTSRSARVFRTCWELSSRARRWYGEDLHGLVYTSRTTPQTSSNLAFFASAPLVGDPVGQLHERRQLLDQLVIDDGFRIDLPGWF